MAVQLILYPQVYDGYYSWTAYGNNSTTTGAAPKNTTTEPVLTQNTSAQILGNSNMNGAIYGEPLDIGSQPAIAGQFASNQPALITNPAPIGKWRTSYSSNLAATLPVLEEGKLKLTTATTMGTAMAYTTVTGLQAGNTYRILVVIDSGPVGTLKIGATGGTHWRETTEMNGRPNMQQLGGPVGTETGGMSWINALNGMDIGQPLNSAITTQARYYQNFTAKTNVEVLQISFLASSPTNEPLIIDDVSIVAAPQAPAPTISINPTTGAAAPTQPTLMQTFLDDGQVIVDLYKDETIPLNLSVDNFTSVDEKIASYSKAFMVPATKHNNKIFSFYYDVTRSQNHDIFFFNPFAKTKAKIKDDSVLIFEGWMKLINVQEKDGQVSYNINLYSQPTTFCDYLKAATIGDLNFNELGHLYSMGNIQDSWSSTGITLDVPLPAGSYAGTAGATTTQVLKYPFINWAGAFELESPNLIGIKNLEDVFRPVVQCKYLLDKFFEATPFTYESTFLNSTAFSKLYMDFNWGGDSGLAATFALGNSETVGSGSTGTGTSTWVRMILPEVRTDIPAGTVYQHYDFTTGEITIQHDNSWIMGKGMPRLKKTHHNTDGEWRMMWDDGSGPVQINTGGIIWNNSLISTTPNVPYTSCYHRRFDALPVNADQCGAGFAVQWTMDQVNSGDIIYYEFRKTAGAGSITMSDNADVSAWAPDFKEDQFNIVEHNVMTFTITGGTSTIAFLMEGLRAGMKQYDFWSGIKTMFNLVTMADEVTENHLIIEPYADIFLNNPNTKQLDWTNKVDVSNIKMMPLNKIPKRTVFSYVNDEADYRMQIYKKALGGYEYGTYTYEAGAQFFSILTGEKKIICKPFAATLVAPLTMLWPEFIVSHIYAAEGDAGVEFKAFDNKPRILIDEGEQALGSYNGTPNEYRVGWLGAVPVDKYGRMSHLDTIPTFGSTVDLNWGSCPLVNPVGGATLPADNLFNTYWYPYYDALYNPDCRILKIKAKLTPEDINAFRFWDKIMVKNREYRVNKIQYSSGALAILELILIP